jgi:hypothetical protein
MRRYYTQRYQQHVEHMKDENDDSESAVDPYYVVVQEVVPITTMGTVIDLMKKKRKLECDVVICILASCLVISCACCTPPGNQTLCRMISFNGFATINLIRHVHDMFWQPRVAVCASELFVIQEPASSTVAVAVRQAFVSRQLGNSKARGASGKPIRGRV